MCFGKIIVGQGLIISISNVNIKNLKIKVRSDLFLQSENLIISL